MAIGRLMVASGAARVTMLGLSAVATVLTARIIVDELGPAGYVEYGLLIAVPLLLPFLDLGTGAAVINALAGASEADSPEVGRVLLGALRILVSSAVALILAAVLVSVVGGWPLLLGSNVGSGASGYLVGACVALFALSVPMSLGQRVLVGVGKNHIAILCQGLQAPMLLAFVAVTVDRESGVGSFPAVLFFVSVLLVNLVFFRYGVHLRNRDFRFAMRRLFDRRVRGARVMKEGWPALVLLVAGPIAFHSDRLVLSHFVQEADLLRYTVASQVYLPVMSISATVSLALWPHYSAMRSRGEWPSPWKATLMLAGAMTAVCVAMVVPTQLVYGYVVADGSLLPLVVPVTFGLFVVAVTLNQGVAYSMMDAPGMRFQGGWAVVMTAANVVLSVVLTPPLGAAGPLLASAICVVALQFVPNSLRWRSCRSRRSTGSGVATAQATAPNR